MARDENSREQATLPRECVLNPHVRLIGEAGEDMLRSMLDQLAEVPDGNNPLTIEISTLGGDAEMARRMVLEVELARERLNPRRLVFLGKTCVYSAGVTLMSAFPREDRFLTEGAVLLIHVRQLEKTVEVSGPMRASLPLLQSLCAQIELGMEVEENNFKNLIAGSDVTMEELLEKGLHNWYVHAPEALKRGLIAGIV